LIRKSPLYIYCLLIVISNGTLADVDTSTNKSYRLFASGDTMLSRRLPSLVYQLGPQYPLRSLDYLIKDADIAMTNLECVIATQGSFWDKQENKPFYYRAPPIMLDVLTEAGIDVVSTSNNHAMDFGPDALLEERELLEMANIAAIGSGRNIDEAAQPVYIKTGDIIVAFLGITTYNEPIAARPDRAGVFWADNNNDILKILGPVIAEARRHADLVVFTPHWGGNWTDGPTESRVQLAHTLIDLGVDAIMGHSAHQLHGVEIYNGHPIVYDMGNFLWELQQYKNRTRYTAGFVFDFDHTGFTKLTIYPMEMQFGRTIPAEGDTLQYIQLLMTDMSKKINPAIEFQQDGDALVLELHPSSRPVENKTSPEILHMAGQTRSLPDILRFKKSNIVYDAAPEWTTGQQPIKLSHGVEIIGSRVVEAVHRDGGFYAEVVLQVSRPLPGWYAEIKGVERHGRDEFIWQHPVANGDWPPESWQNNQIGADLIMVRPPQLQGGTYDLYWRLVNPAVGETTTAAETDKGLIDGFIPIGEIWAGSAGILRTAAGVSWSGDLDAMQSFLQRFDLTKDRIMLFGGAGIVVLSLAIIPGAMMLWRRRPAD